MDVHLTPIQLTIVDAVRQLSGELPRSAVAKLLVGSESMRTLHLKGSPFFGRLARHTRKSVMHNLDVLIQQGILALDHYDRVIIPPDD